MMKLFTTGCFAIFLALAWIGGASAASFSTVVIDAGHGGQDRGGLPGQRISEKHLALDVAQRVDKILRGAGMRTVMTRNRDVFIPLSRRVAIANNQRNAVFVSIHFNAAKRREARGIETFHYGAGRPMAASIQNQLMRAVNTENRGVKKRGFYVLRNTRIPAVLVECGFLTNASEARLSMRADYRQKLAQQIAAGILQSAGRRTLPSPVRQSPVMASKPKPAAQPAVLLAKRAMPVSRAQPQPAAKPSRVPAPTAAASATASTGTRPSEEELRRRFLIATGRIPSG